MFSIILAEFNNIVKRTIQHRTDFFQRFERNGLRFAILFALISRTVSRQLPHASYAYFITTAPVLSTFQKTTPPKRGGKLAPGNGVVVCARSGRRLGLSRRKRRDNRNSNREQKRAPKIGRGLPEPASRKTAWSYSLCRGEPLRICAAPPRKFRVRIVSRRERQR